MGKKAIVEQPKKHIYAIFSFEVIYDEETALRRVYKILQHCTTNLKKAHAYLLENSKDETFGKIYVPSYQTLLNKKNESPIGIVEIYGIDEEGYEDQNFGMTLEVHPLF